MTEQEYIILSNKNAIASAQKILNDVQIEPEYGIDKNTFHTAYKALNALRKQTGDLLSIDTNY